MTDAVTWGDLQKLAAEAGFTNAPVGDHLMEITKSTYKRTSNQKDMVTVIFKVVNPGPANGATQPHNFVISPESAGAMGFFFRYMAALGFDNAFFASYATLPPTQVVQMLTPMLVGRRGLITIGPDRNDADRLVVNGIKRAPAGSDAIAASPLTPVPPTAQAAAQSVPPPPPVTHAQPVAVPPGPAPMDYATAPDPPF
jgi:hypothetical protein